jgi:hypothetical protein
MESACSRNLRRRRVVRLYDGSEQDPDACGYPHGQRTPERDRIMLGMTLAPPARAANAPKSARKSSEVPDTKIIRLDSGDKAVVKSGMAAPTAKLLADASAA